MSIETLQATGEFNDKGFDYLEIEKQFQTINPEAFESLKDSSDIEIIEQLYINHPDEPYSLRLRQTTTMAGTVYTATIKDRGRVVPNGLARMEVETQIDEGTYLHYRAQPIYPVLRKLRATPIRDVSIDWTEGETGPIVEIENIGTNPDARQFYDQHRDHLVDHTGDASVSSEAQAYAGHTGEVMMITQDVTADIVVAEIIAGRQEHPEQIVVGISGRSGSGKSTLSRQVADLLNLHGLDVDFVSTDDYHRGKTWLESTIRSPWIDWDAPEVYDTNALAFDIWQLQQGQSVDRRRFDFGTGEPVIDGNVKPTSILIVEGIYAGSDDLAAHRHLHFEVTTPLATCIGRRLARDKREGRGGAIGNSEASLRYQLEFAEPAYQRQKQLA